MSLGTVMQFSLAFLEMLTELNRFVQVVRGLPNGMRRRCAWWSWKKRYAICNNGLL